MHFSQWIGIDQTGAALDGGKKAVSLPVVRVRADGEMLVVQDAEWWETLHFSEQRIGEGVRTAIVLDCVLGLSVAVQKMHPLAADVRKLLEYAASHPKNSGERIYGRDVAAEFFAEFAIEGDSLRECERMSGAQSVFKTIPWQRNIQTGTWRMWYELGRSIISNAASVKIWPQEAEAADAQLWLFEAWPTLLWKAWLRQTSRRLESGPQALATMVAEAGLQLRISKDMRGLVLKDANVADSLVMAVSAAVMDHMGVLMNPWPGFGAHPTARTEGWIIGLSPEFRHVQSQTV